MGSIEKKSRISPAFFIFRKVLTRDYYLIIILPSTSEMEIKMHNYSRDLDREQIKELIEQRNDLNECVKAHLKISDEDRLTEQQQRVIFIPTTRRSS